MSASLWWRLLRRSLLRVLERGSQGKAILDAAIDAASAMQVRRARPPRPQQPHELL
jgi:hypothetical protein